MYSPQVNIRSSAHFHPALTDVLWGFSHDVIMAAPSRPLWYLQEWFATQGLKQRALITRLDWLPAKANKVWHGIQIARLDEVAEIADLLNIAPHELLMHPEDAMAIRRLRTAIAEVTRAEPIVSQPAAASDAQRTGTDG